jgi:hypothetical protein
MIVVTVDEDVEDIKIYWTDLVPKTQEKLYPIIMMMNNPQSILANKKPIAVYKEEVIN